MLPVGVGHLACELLVGSQHRLQRIQEEFAELVDEIFDLYCKRRGIQSTEQSD
jgi:hypothetical protein